MKHLIKTYLGETLVSFDTYASKSGGCPRPLGSNEYHSVVSADDLAAYLRLSERPIVSPRPPGPLRVIGKHICTAKKLALAKMTLAAAEYAEAFLKTIGKWEKSP